MKKITFASLFLLIFTICCSQTTSLNFTSDKDLSLEQVMKVAQSSKKIIFVDIYTNWCGPCKWMDANVFADTQIIERFNQKFINYKVDGDSVMGMNMVSQYRIDSYPSYLFLGANGKVLKRIEGMMPAKMFLEEANEVKNGEK